MAIVVAVFIVVVAFLFVLLLHIRAVVVRRDDGKYFPNQPGQKREDDKLDQQVERVEEYAARRERLEFVGVVVYDVAPSVLSDHTEHHDQCVVVGCEVADRLDKEKVLLSYLLLGT